MKDILILLAIDTLTFLCRLTYLPKRMLMLYKNKKDVLN